MFTCQYDINLIYETIYNTLNASFDSITIDF